MNKDDLKEYEEFLKKKDEIIKKIESEKREIKDKTYQVFDDIEKAIKESNVEAAAKTRDIEKNQHLPIIFFNIFAVVWGLFTFKKELLKEAYIVPGIKRKMLIYTLASTLISLSLALNYFLRLKEPSLLIIAGFNLVLGPFAMLILIIAATYLIQTFFFLFSGLKKHREIENLLSYLALVFALLVVPSTIFFSQLFTIAAFGIFIVWAIAVMMFATSMMFGIKKWESLISILAFFVFMLAIWFGLKITAVELQWNLLFSLGW